MNDNTKRRDRRLMIEELEPRYAPGFTYFPSVAVDDGRFLALVGASSNSLAGDFIQIEFAAPANKHSLTIGIFDGESSGMWDSGNVPLEFSIYSDPKGDGSNAGNSAALKLMAMGNIMPDNTWYNIDIETSSDALSPSDYYFYTMTVRNTNPSVMAYSAFKVRTDESVFILPQAFSFMVPAATMNDIKTIYPKYPNLSTTTYDGNWEFKFYVPASTASMLVWDGDMDYGASNGSYKDTNDPDTPNVDANGDPWVPAWAVGAGARPEGVAVASNGITGSPADDSSSVYYRRETGIAGYPGVVYSISDPNGNIFWNYDPSGNMEWEKFEISTDPAAAALGDPNLGPGDPAWDAARQIADCYAGSGPLSAGIWTVKVYGVDISNLNAWRFLYTAMGSTPPGDPPPSPPPQPYLVGDTVWLDSNGNGNYDPAVGEVGIEGVTLNLSNGLGIADRTATTDAQGSYSFDVPEGYYTVTVASENFQPGGALYGMFATTPNALSYTVTSENVLTYDFGYKNPTPAIHVDKSGPAYAHAGDPLAFDYIVTNIGDVALGDVSVMDDKAGLALYVSGDADSDAQLDLTEAWTFRKSYAPGFTFPDALTNTATATGTYAGRTAQDQDDYTLYPLTVRKEIFQYWDSPANTLRYPETDNTQFQVEVLKGGQVLDTFAISRSISENLWLSEGTYTLQEVNVPDGYLSGYDSISYTTGEGYPDWTFPNIITSDLTIDKWGPTTALEGQTITYNYQLSNAGPASVRPTVTDNITGTPTYVSGDTDLDGRIDASETWMYQSQYVVPVGSRGTNIVNTVTVGDADRPDYAGWMLGGERDLNNNTDSWSVYIPGAGIGDFVWHDLFHSIDHAVDGIQDTGEPGLAGVTVQLKQNGQVIATTTTNPSGYYQFTNLAAGTYTVKIADSNFASGGLLQGWYASQVNRGSNDAIDSDGNTSAHDATVTIAAGATNNDMDFGFFRVGIALEKTGPDAVIFGPVVATSPGDGSTYTSPINHRYTVENATSNPFYSIKFNEQGEGVKNGASDTFTYTIDSDAFDPSKSIRVSAKASTYQYSAYLQPIVNKAVSAGSFKFTFVSAVDDGTTTAITIKVKNSYNRALSNTAFALPQSEVITYHFRVENTGDLVLHGGAHVYDAMLNTSGDHEIWSAVFWPGQVAEFDKTYTPTQTGTLVNNATALGHPEHPGNNGKYEEDVPNIDDYYVTNVNDAASWTVHVLEQGGGGCYAMSGDGGSLETLGADAGTLALLGGSVTVTPSLDTASGGSSDVVGTPGYWATNLDAWPIDFMVLGSQAYTKNEAATVLQKTDTADLSYMFAQALIATKLNLRVGTYSDALLYTIHDADEWLTANPIGSGVNADSPQWQTAGTLYAILDQFNNGTMIVPAAMEQAAQTV